MRSVTSQPRPKNTVQNNENQTGLLVTHGPSTNSGVNSNTKRRRKSNLGVLRVLPDMITTI
ncbi:Uncharacterised protein [Mycobacteroides abscessus subsp. abscessus]|nr:Uncharacterised protein [Mycobacteroides abscessus subsp. abscessus]